MVGLLGRAVGDQIAGTLFTRRDRFAGSLLLPGIAGNEPARRAVGDVDEARAVDAGRG